MPLWRRLAALPATVWLFGCVSLLNDAASDLVYPLMPLYLSAVLMAGPRALGLIEGLAEAAGSLLKLASGVLADRFGHIKAWVVGGYGLAALARPLLAFAGAWPTVLLLRFADRVGKGLRTSPRDALLARAVGAGERGLAFGLQRAMDNAGAVLGPLAAAGLLASGLSLREVLLWAALPGTLVVALTLAIREPPVASAAARAAMDWRFGSLPPRLRRYLAVLALFTLGNSSNMFLLLRARELGLAEVQVPLIWALAALVATALSAPLAAASDRIGRRPLIVAGWLLYGAVYLALGLVDAPGWGLWPLLALYGVFLAATEGAEKALVADLAPTGRLGTAYGWFNLIAGLMLLPASLAFGALWQGFGAPAAFGFGAGCAFAAAALLRSWVFAGES